MVDRIEELETLLVRWMRKTGVEPPRRFEKLRRATWDALHCDKDKIDPPEDTEKPNAD